MIQTNRKEIDELLVLLRCALTEQPLPPCDGIDFDRLLTLAKRQQVYTMILPVLEAGGVLDEAQHQAWNNYRLSELTKMVTMDAERRAICAELDKENIAYMFLKGLEIRAYYPLESMRQMSDNDILYDESRRDDLIKLMKKRGYYIGASGGISDDFYKKPYCTFEFHRTLFNPKEAFCPDFNPWQHAVAYAPDSAQRVISREDNYLYALGHTYKHYACVDGCGIRFICDLYLLTHSDDVLDWEYINRELERFGIADFNRTALTLSAAVFEDGELTEDAKALLDFMFEGGVFGAHKVDMQAEIAHYGSKTGYLWHRLFPSKADMCAEYRALRQKPYLLWYYYLYRLIDKYRHNRKYMQRDLDALRKTNKKHEDK
ncbi:MAG: nucleotidyltransferase family protein [Eubacterium sp.]|nr:nucleotidyltransferase family protein [Eubacterium sp.]